MCSLPLLPHMMFIVARVLLISIIITRRLIIMFILIVIHGLLRVRVLLSLIMVLIVNHIMLFSSRRITIVCLLARLNYHVYYSYVFYYHT